MNINNFNVIERFDNNVELNHNNDINIQTIIPNYNIYRIERVAISPPTYLPFLEKICHKHFNRFRVKNTEYFENVTFEEVLWFLVSLFDEPSYASSNEMHKKQYLKEHQK